MASGKASPQRNTNITFQAFSCRLAPETPREVEKGSGTPHLGGGADDPGANLKGNLKGEITIKEEFIANPPLAGSSKKCPPPPPLCGSYCTYPCPPCGPLAPEYEPTVMDGPYGTSSDPDNPCPPERDRSPTQVQAAQSGISPSPDSSVQTDPNNNKGGEYHQVCVHPSDTCGSPTCYTCLGNLAQPRTDFIPLPQREEVDKRVHCHPMGADKNRKTWRWPCVRCRDIAGKPKPPTHEFIPCCVYKGRPEHFPEMTKECYRLLESIAGPESSRPILQEDLCTNPGQRRCRSNERGSRCRGGSQSPERPAAGFNACYPPCNLLPARSETKTIHSVEACRSDPVLCGTCCEPYTVTEQQLTTNRTDFVEPPCSPCCFNNCYLAASGNPPEKPGSGAKSGRASAGGTESHPPTPTGESPEEKEDSSTLTEVPTSKTPTQETDQQDPKYDKRQSDTPYANQTVQQDPRYANQGRPQDPNIVNSSQHQDTYGSRMAPQQELNYLNQPRQKEDGMYSNQTRPQDMNYENQMRQQQAHYMRQQQDAMYANQMRQQQEAAYANRLRYQQEMYANQMRQQQNATYLNQGRTVDGNLSGQTGPNDQPNIRQGNPMDSSYNVHGRRGESPGPKKGASPHEVAYTLPNDGKQVTSDPTAETQQGKVPDAGGYQSRHPPSQPPQAQYTYAPRQTQAFAPPQNYSSGPSQNTGERRSAITPTPVGAMLNAEYYATNTPVVTPFTQKLSSPPGNSVTEQEKAAGLQKQQQQQQLRNQYQPNQQHQFQPNQYQPNQQVPLQRRPDYSGNPQSYTMYMPDSANRPADNRHPSGDWNSSEELRSKVAAARYEEPMRKTTSIS